MMDELKRREWVKTIKAGDVVAVCGSARQERSYSKCVVAKVTPTGRIKVRTNADDIAAYDMVFDEDGERHVGGTWGHTEQLEPWTKDIEKLLAHRQLVARVGRYLDFGQVSREKLTEATDEELVALHVMLRRYAR